MTLAGCEEEAVMRRCLELGAHGCSPALNPAEVRRKMRSGMARTGRYDMSNAGVVQRFAVTPEELAQIPELKRKARPVTKKSRVRAELKSLASKLGRTPTASELRECLGAHEIRVSRTTLWRLTGAVDSINTGSPDGELRCFSSAAEEEVLRPVSAAGLKQETETGKSRHTPARRPRQRPRQPKPYSLSS
jgi:hypothetical protein